MKQSTRTSKKLKKFKQVKRKTVSLPKGQMVKMDYLHGEQLPLIQATSALNLADWTQDNIRLIEEKLVQYGAVLFRGFDQLTPASFEKFSLAVCSDLLKDNGEHVPETANGRVQRPVFYSPDKRLLWHNENSFNYHWPMKIIFGCAQPAQQGGETTLVDSRKVFEKIPPDIREQFIKKQVRYVRNYDKNLGQDWQEVFRTSDKTAVEQKCRESHMAFEWKEGDRLKTVAVRPATVKHPKTGEKVWFNQAQHWHVACLDATTRESLYKLFDEEDLPRSCYFSDGSPIEDGIMEEICQIYEELEMPIPWQKGDVALVDNLLTAHGRNPYVGQRKLLVTLGDMAHYHVE